ncbi:MAG TPA: hypothetical protein VHY08_22005 [Bacillota bacterium]|nr:hypothetical protein [Bacillota bacterium]
MDLLMIFIMTVVYALFVVFDFIPVFRGKKRKLIWLYLSLLILSYSLSLLIGLGVKIPSPAPPIKKIITSIVKIKG